MSSTYSSVSTGGLWWFQDLAAPDPYCVLPIVASFSFLGIMEFALRGRAASMQPMQYKVPLSLADLRPRFWGVPSSTSLGLRFIFLVLRVTDLRPDSRVCPHLLLLGLRFTTSLSSNLPHVPPLMCRTPPDRCNLESSELCVFRWHHSSLACITRPGYSSIGSQTIRSAWLKCSPSTTPLCVRPLA